MTIIESAKALQPHLSEMRREFHREPEISGCEAHTMARIVRELEAIGGYQLAQGLGTGGHGVLAEISGERDGPTIALRADMDALQIEEKTGLPYASECSGIMHACGHDIHVTALLGAARLLAERKRDLLGTVRLIFQPAEELSPVGGSRAMIEAGALKGADAVFGLHVWPDLPVGTVGVKQGPAMAASDHFTVKFVGKSSHAARPQDGCDAVVAGAQFVTAAQSIVSRNTDPLKAAVITIGQFFAGARYNIVAEECVLEGTCRTFDPEVRNVVERRLEEVLQGICGLSGCKGSLEYCRGYDPLVNDDAMAAYVHSTAEGLFGREHAVWAKEPTMCSEDFGSYLAQVPGAFAWLGCREPEAEAWPLHNCHFAPDEGVLWRGAALLAQLAVSFQQ